MVAGEALALVPPENDLLHTTATVALGSAYLLEGAIEEAVGWLNQGWHTWAELQTRNMLAEAEFMRGNLGEAQRLSQQLLELDTKNTWQEGFALVRLGRIYFEWNQLDKVRPWVELALTRGQSNPQAAYLTEAYLSLARLEFAEGNWLDAFEALVRSREAAECMKNASLKAIVESWDNYFHFLAKDQETAWQGLETPPNLASDNKLTYQKERQYLPWVRILLATRQAGEALLALEKLLQFAREQGRIISQVELLGLKALALELSEPDSIEGQKEAALATIGESLQLAAPSNLVRFYLDEGEPMQKLLVDLRQKNQGSEFVERLLEAFDAVKVTSKSPGPVKANNTEQYQYTVSAFSQLASRGKEISPALIEPLSERELEVLRLIGEGISNKAIAEKLYLSLATVKTHINHLYAKLGVENRVQALSRARSLNLFKDI